MNIQTIMSSGIQNIAKVSDNIVRGETLWAARNRKFIPLLRDAGVTVIIDLRTADFTNRYVEMCSGDGLRCFHFPVDSYQIDDEEIIGFLPQLFSLLDQENCYISCQQGLHRTDIALALYYLFHPSVAEIPNLFGHQKVPLVLRRKAVGDFSRLSPVDGVSRKNHSCKVRLLTI